jgi:hypothetical protein
MRSNLSAAVLLILVLVCFTLGLVSALGRHPAQDAGPSAGSPSLPSTASFLQRTVLFLGVDSLESSDPSLLAVWLASFRLPGRDIFLLGLPTDLIAAGENQASLSSLFRWSSEEGPDPGFLSAVQQAAPLTPDLIVCLDRDGFITLVDYLGGLDLGGVHLDGAQTMAVLDMLTGDEDASLATQGRLLEAMSLRAPLVGSTPDLTSLLNLAPMHAYLSTPVTEAAALVAPLLPIEPDAIYLDTLSSPSTSPAPPSPP